MKHRLKITIILLSMFIATQFIGLAVQYADIFHIQKEVDGVMQSVSNPHLQWIQPPEAKTQSESITLFSSLIFAFVVAVLLLFFLTKLKVEFIMRGWFFLVVSVSIFLAVYSFEKLLKFPLNSSIALFIPIVVALPLAFIKIYQRNFLIHNVTELLIYPGIAVVFVPILNFWTVLVLLILISIYDIWAVWHSGIMQKMAKYQIDKLKIFSGFFVPYISKGMKSKIKEMKQKFKKSELKKKKIKINVALLGGGDIVFPIITAGVILKTASITLPFGLKPFTGGIFPALFVIVGATLGLAYLFIFSEKKKFYPAMPFITAGILLFLLLSQFLV